MTANISDARDFHAPLARDGCVAEEISRGEAAVIEQADPHVNVGHAVTRDRADRDKTKPAILDYLRHAQTKSGRSPMELAREFFRLNRGRGKLTLPEYVQYGVFDTNRYSPDEQSQFLTNTLHWPITHICCDMTWQATTEDKWLCSHILARSGIRIPETLAVIDKTERSYPGTHKISTAGQFRDFVTSRDIVPFFGKEIRGICSFGAFLVQGPDENAVRLKGHDPLPYDTFMEQFVGETPYLLQRLETNHGFFDRYTDNLATVRVCILIDKADIKIPFAVLKLPSCENLADSFWRPGNLACDLDTQSGKILGVRSKDALGITEHAAHPATGEPLLGEVVPMWGRVLDLAHRCAPIFHPVRYQSMDIAITQEGPVLIEINTGGGFDLPQLASGKGFLTDEVCEFFRACGYQKL
ncbi:MAG: hypothetical protein O7B81_12670 [Gammaproteobacteria bacterium]|nr:hypothetical protein [Gammaproteobacteria bacterium]